MARCAAALGALLVLAYATLPWWLPRQYLARQFTEVLSTRLGLPVTIGRLDLSWREGIALSGLRIGNPQDFGGGDMVRVGRLQCDLSPVRLLLTGRLRWAEVRDAHLHVVVNDDRQVNLAALQGLWGGSPPEWLVVHQATVTVRLPRHERILCLDVGDLQYRAGRLRGLGQISMSAALAQENHQAPVSLIASAGGEKAVAAADARFHFTDVDIAQLSLPVLLGLPLKHLSGISSGELYSRLNAAGAVDQFTLSLKVKDFQAEPVAGPGPLAVDEAELSLSASYDPFTDPLNPEGGRFQASAFRLRLPGIDLQGAADVEGGTWEGIRNLQVEGKVNPALFWPLVSGQSGSLPGGIEVDGDVGVSLNLREKGDDLTAGITLDAEAARVLLRERQVKPPREALRLLVSATLARSARRVTDLRANVTLGGNRIVAEAVIPHDAKEMTRWAREGDSARLETVLLDLADLDWRGSLIVSEVDSLIPLPGLECLQQVDLSGGRVAGDWSVRHAGRLIVSGNLSAPPAADLSVGRWFVKPPTETLHAAFSTEVDSKALGLSGASLTLMVGRGQLVVDDARVALLPGAASRDAPQPGARLEGHFSIRDAAAVLACIPAARDWTDQVAGDLTGQFLLVQDPSRFRACAQANATLLKVSAGDWFEKPAGEQADLTVDFHTDRALPGGPAAGVDVLARLGAETVEGSLVLPRAAHADSVRCRVRVSVADAAWLLPHLPALARGLAPYQPRGSLRATLDGEVSQDGMSGQVAVDADDLAFRLPQSGGDKARRSPARLRIAGTLGAREVEVTLLAVDLGRSSLSAEGALRLAPPERAVPAGEYWPVRGLQSCRLTLRGRLANDPALQALLPDLARQARRYGLEGAVRVEGEVAGRPEGLDVSGRIDATDLAAAAEGQFRKPAGRYASATFEAWIPADASAIQVRDLFLDGRDIQVRADAVIPVMGDVPLGGHLAVSAPNLRRLGDWLPQVEPYALEGSVFLDTEWSRRDGRDTAKYLTVRADNVIGVLSGKACRLDGTVTFEDLAWDERRPRLGRVTARSLQFAAGPTHGLLVCDVRNPMTAPVGRVDLRCSDLDVYDLTQWHAAPPPQTSAAPEPLTESQKAELRARADRFVADLRRAILPADLEVGMEMERMRYYDADVRCMYDGRGMVARIQAKDGVLKADYRCGISGGDMGLHYVLDLKSPEPCLRVRGGNREVMSGENIMAQLAKEFPGNTVYGTLSLTQDLSYPFGDLVAGAMDSRSRAFPVGWASTVTTDGVIRGRAAPRFIANLFPGLNLASYRYRRMTSFTQYNPDGGTSADMIFGGTAYDIYIEGSTDANRIGQYEIGVILLGTPQSAEFNHLYRAGRLPILNFKARIENGQFYDEEVWYQFPTETAFTIFLKNNIVYRIWLASVGKGGSRAILNEPTTAPAGR